MEGRGFAELSAVFTFYSSEFIIRRRGESFLPFLILVLLQNIVCSSLCISKKYYIWFHHEAEAPKSKKTCKLLDWNCPDQWWNRYPESAENGFLKQDKRGFSSFLAKFYPSNFCSDFSAPHFEKNHQMYYFLHQTPSSML